MTGLFGLTEILLFEGRPRRDSRCLFAKQVSITSHLSPKLGADTLAG